MSVWIDFKQLRERLDFSAVLQHYAVVVKVKGMQASGLCPLPTHPERTDGQKRTASFSANLTKGCWRCFGGCNLGGNTLEFACRMEGFDPNDPEQFRKGALKVAETFGILTPRTAKTTAGASETPKPASTANSKVAVPAISKQDSVPVTAAKAMPSAPTMPFPAPPPAVKVIINEPLNFELKHLDPEHPYLTRRGLSAETIQHFGLGFCAKGIMVNRIAIPLHDMAGKLVGYAGRLVDDSKVCDEHPKYRFPGTRERNGIRNEFHKNLLLYNAHRIEKPVADLVVVEGFASTWWLWQSRYQNVVALMGSSCSKEQAELVVGLVHPGGRIWAFPDGDAAGDKCAESILGQVASHRFVRRVRLIEDAQPTDCSLLNLSFLLEGIKATPLQPLLSHKTGV